ncbi:MAG: class I tRNA ligase family protein, partial [SAR202 cluster bacterium]|nr:class I tRNA ligase family protein [SAR202 cluster bacterium]
DPSALGGKPADQAAVRDLARAVHKTVRKVTEDLERFKFNTSLAALMELSNAMSAAWDAGNVDAVAWRDAVERLLLLLAPMAPHFTEELWERTGHPFSIHQQLWPKWDAELAADESVTLIVQVNGKLRDRIEVPVAIAEAEARRVALASERVQAHLGGRDPRKVIYVPGKLINIVG